MTKILVIEDHPLMQMAIQTVLSAETDLELTPPLFDRDTILRNLRQESPDLILFDLGLPNIDPIELVNEIRDVDPAVKILIYSGSTDHQLIARIIRERVNGYITKNSSISDLVEAIRSVVAGKPYFSGIASEALAEDIQDISKDRTRQLLSSLTAREREIFDLIVERHDTNQTAQGLAITPSAVRSHIAHICRKFGLNSQKDLLLFAVENDLNRTS